MIVRIGRYKNWKIQEVPSSFLKWLIDSSWDEELADAATDEYDRRTIINKHFELDRDHV